MKIPPAGADYENPREESMILVVEGESPGTEP